MVEMTETANILNNATPQSLVLMDEVGRGTSTFDGLSLAWACAQHLATHVKPYTLFATHYFELTTLPELAPSAINVHLDATEYEDHIIFLHKVQTGPASQSYGLQVAQLAGVPHDVISEARQKLRVLEQGETLVKQSKRTTSARQPDLFSAPTPHPVIEQIKSLNIDRLTPLQALQLLYDLQQSVR